MIINSFESQFYRTCNNQLKVDFSDLDFHVTPYKLPLIDIIPTFPAITPATVAALRFEKLGEMMDGFIFSTV